MTEDTVDRIRIYGDPVLRKVSGEITDFGAVVEELENRLIDTMFSEENGIGLSAPQIGVSKRILVIDMSFGERFDDILTMINPEILDSAGESTVEEGCLSVPGIYEPVTRPSSIRARYRDIHGEVQEIEDDGFLARVIQHEVDHLNGILFVDRLGTVKRTMLAKKLKSLAREVGTG